MAYIRVAKLVCDKCGKETSVDPSIENPFLSSFVVAESGYADWGEVKGKHFCGDCHSAYKEMRARQEAEIAEVFGI